MTIEDAVFTDNGRVADMNIGGVLARVKSLPCELHASIGMFDAGEGKSALVEGNNFDIGLLDQPLYRFGDRIRQIRGNLVEI